MSKIILVVSYPKSGATWFKFLMYACRFGTLNSSFEVNRYYPEIGNKSIIKCKLEKESEKYFFVKSHETFSIEHPHLENVRNVIYIVRNPINTFISRINHYLLEGNYWLKETAAQIQLIKDFIENANSGINQFNGGWNYHVISWLSQKNKLNPYLIRYEDLLMEPEKILLNLNESLNLNFKPKFVKSSIELCQIHNLKEIETFEIMNNIPGMFYSEKRKESLLRHGFRFIDGNKTFKLEDLITSDILNQVLEQCKDGLKLCNYDQNLMTNYSY